MKKLFTLLVSLGFFCFLYARPVTEQTAKTAAEYFIKYKTRSQLSAVSNPGLKLVYQATLKTTQSKTTVPGFYVFNATTSRGFVIVSGDDHALPVLGYSDEENFDPKNIPVTVLKWLESYKTQLRYIIENKIEAGAEIETQWKNLASGNTSELSQPSLNTVVVAPLMQTTWDQSPYYNAQCPYNNQYNERTVTGCVATAMAQIMKKWNHPAKGAGFHSYNSQSYGTLSANFGSTTYEWGSMPNNVTNANAAVATLMYQVGVSVDMNYGVGQTGGSGAYVISTQSPVTNCAEYALKTYFGYDNTLQGVAKDNYTSTQWHNMLKAELNAGRPILYAGFGNGGGHCFVADGYDDNNMYHFNWGWSGHYDGYFALTALNPAGLGTGGGSGGFNSGQQAVIGIKPGSGGGGGGGGGGAPADIRLYGNITAATSGNSNTGAIYYGEPFTISVNIANYASTAFTGSFGAAVFDDANNFIDFVDTTANSSLAGTTWFSASFSSNGLFSMLPGNYKIGVFFRPTGGNWSQVANGSYVNSKSLAVINPNDIELNSAISISPGTLLTQASAASATLNIVNDGSTTFTGQYLVGLYDLDGNFVQTINTIDETDLPPGYTYNSPYLNFTTNAITAAPGSYLLAVLHKRSGGDWQLTGSSYFQNPVKVTVQAAAIPTDAYEVNNTVVQAFTLPVSFAGNTATVSTTGSNCHVGSDYDYYKVVLPAGYSYSIDARLHDSYNSGNGITYTLDALFSDSTSAEGNTWSDAFDDVMPAPVQVNGGTTVYFKVSPYFTGEVGSYLLSMTITRSVLAISTYTFTGNGNWSNAANWSGGIIPPTPLLTGKEIIINPQPGGECVLNVEQHINSGAKLTVAPNARFRIAGGLTRQ